MQNPVEILKCLFVDGGVEIVTPGVARTLIQPDADVLHFLEESLLTEPDPKARLLPHFDKIQEFLDSLKGAKAVLDWSFWLIALGIWGMVIVQLLGGAAFDTDMLVKFVLGFMPPFAKPGVIWALKRFFNYKISQLAK